MGSRVAQHYVQVVGTPDVSGELRVRRLYAEVLIASSGISTHNESVNQSLGITDAAVGRIETQDVDQSISFSSVANLTYELSVSQTLDFVSLGGRGYDQSITHNMGLTTNFTQFNYIEDRAPVEQVLGLTQDVQTLSIIPLAQDMGLSQSVSVSYPTKVFVNHFLGLQQARLPQPHSRSVSQNLALTAVMPNVPLYASASNTLAFVQDSPIGRVDDYLLLTQSAEGAKGYLASNTMSLVQTIAVTGIFIRPITHNDILSQYLTFYEDTPCNRKNYTPFQGEGATPPDNLLPPQGKLTDRFSLYTPTTGARSLEVILRAPEMDDRDRNAYNRIQGETRGGKIRVYADPIWPKVRTIAVTIVGVTEAQVDELQTFVLATLGQQIGFTDWKGNLWQGTIMNPNEVATQDGKKKWTVSLEIEGEQIDELLPGEPDDGQTVTFSQSVGVEKV